MFDDLNFLDPIPVTPFDPEQWDSPEDVKNWASQQLSDFNDWVNEQRDLLGTFIDGISKQWYEDNDYQWDEDDDPGSGLFPVVKPRDLPPGYKVRKQIFPSLTDAENFVVATGLATSETVYMVDVGGGFYSFATYVSKPK